MASIEFYYMPESPPCRAVEMTAAVAGVKLNKHYINLMTKDHLKDDYLKINPTHQVPFIIDGDVKLGESRAIMAYIVNKYMPADNSLYPRGPEARALVDELLYRDMSLFALGSKLLRPMVFGNAKELNPDDENTYKDVLGLLDKHLETNGKNFYLGDNYTIGDISVAATLTFPIVCGYNINNFKHLAAYLNRLKAAIPNYAEINDEAVERMAKFIKSKMDAK